MKKHLLSAIALLTVLSAAAQDAATFRKWGEESLHTIDSTFRKNSFKYMFDENLDGYVTYAWPMGIQLKALIYASKMDSKYLARTEALASEFHSNFWCGYSTYSNFYAYNAVCKGNNDRYYDDNAWIAKDMMDLYDLTKKSAYLDRAKNILKFCMSGECPSGGIRFHESHSVPTNENYDKSATCATAPTTCACLRLFKVTGDSIFLTNGKRLYNAMKTKGWGIGPGYRGYENAVVMQAAILLYQITQEEAYLNDAHHIGYSMDSRYIGWQTRRLNEVGCWGGHDMTDAYVNMYEVDHDQNWLNIAAGYLNYLHTNCRDSKGFYPEEWNDTSKAGKRFMLLDQASACSAFFKMALSPGGVVKPFEPVAIFQDETCNNNGTSGDRFSLGLGVGNYTKDSLTYLGVINTLFQPILDISSFKLQEGYKITLFTKDNFLGQKSTYTTSRDFLGGWNNLAVSLKVESINSSLSDSKTDAPVLVAFQSQTDQNLEISNLPENARLEIFDTTGHRVFEGKTTINTYTVNTSAFQQGLYVLKVSSKYDRQVVKVQIR